MRFGLDKKTKKRIEAKHGLLATCPCCDTDLIPKCGDFKLHHWAHKKGDNCDPWLKKETVWHREWKNKFPDEWQEKVKVDLESNERHIADIYIPKSKIVIEFQNSPITKKELESRERFYKKMIWVVNAKNFSIITFSINRMLKEIKSLEDRLIQLTANKKIRKTYETSKVIQTCQNEIERIEKTYSRKQINLRERCIKRMFYDQAIDILKRRTFSSGEQMHQAILQISKEAERLIDRNKLLDDANQYYKFTWSRKRLVWNYAKLPVFLDMGDELLWIHSESVVKKVPMDTFISKYKNR